jgi:adenosylcobinamide kinase/adenosylcobinamide-phosphate guanylyltransferase
LGEIIFVSGGCRSGKSSYAEDLALNLDGPHHYLATAQAFDDEMEDRILRHKKMRWGKGWISYEESLNPETKIKNISNGVVLLDCLTLWISNLMWEAEKSNETIDEDWMSKRSQVLVDSMLISCCKFIVVSNETGLGIMPINAQARLFGDLAGRTNQVFAKAAKKVIFMVSGLPMVLKDD